MGQGGGRSGHGLRGEQLPAKFESLGTEAIGQKAAVTDAHETFGQDVEEEAAQELRCGEGHLALLVARSVVLPAEGDPLAVKADPSMVGDGDAMGIAAQVAENLLGASESRLGIDLISVL